MIKKYETSSICMVQSEENIDLRLNSSIIFRERKLDNDQVISFRFNQIETYPKLAEVFICTENLNTIIRKEFSLLERKIYKSYLTDSFTEALLSFLHNIEKDVYSKLYIKLITLIHGKTITIKDRKDLTASEYRVLFKEYSNDLDKYLYHDTNCNAIDINYFIPYVSNGNIKLKLVKRFYKIIKDQMLELVSIH